VTKLHSRFRRARFQRLAAAVALVVCCASFAGAQNAPQADSDPAPALADTLSAACSHDEITFAKHLTTPNAVAFLDLPAEQRAALLKRLVLLEDPGKPVSSTGPQGHTIMRCEAGGLFSEMRFGASEVEANLAFIPVDLPPEGDAPRSVRFGLVREGGEWKLLSVGLLLLDLPTLAQQWEQSELDAREAEAVAALGTLAAALTKYQAAFGKLPEKLAMLGPAPPGGIAPEQAGLVDAALAAGENGSYRFRYNIAPAAAPGDESDRDKTDGFALAATPIEYGKTGRRSFYLDTRGTLRGGDKNGAVATAADPQVTEPLPPQP
jgi:hypothetical protein